MSKHSDRWAVWAIIALAATALIVVGVRILSVGSSGFVPSFGVSLDPPFFLPFLFLPIALMGLVGLGVQIWAGIDIWMTVRDHNDDRWETPDILWLVVVIIGGFIGGILWLAVGRSIRRRDLAEAKRRSEQERIDD